MSSQEHRCQQFHDVAMGIVKVKGSILKEITTLRKFLHNNQDYRFTDKAVSRLYDTMQIYCCGSTSSNSNDTLVFSDNKNETDNKKKTTIMMIDDEIKESLLEDALKMPFSVFNTKQKQKMLKWLEDIRKKRSFNKNNQTSLNDNSNNMNHRLIKTLSVIDCDETMITCMDDDTGYTTTFSIISQQKEIVLQIYQKFIKTDTIIQIQCLIGDNDNHSSHNNDSIITITRIIGIVS